MKILIVDDERDQREILAGFLKKKGHDSITATDGVEGLGLIRLQPVDLVLLDHRMPKMNGDEFLAELKKINPLTKTIMITAFASVDTAVKVMQLGADDFMEKPVNLLELEEKINRLEEKLLIDKDVAQISSPIDPEKLPIKIIGNSPVMRNLFSLSVRAAATPWTVLVQGETGTGKELIARLIHLLSSRKENPFVELNCAAIPENLFESELFGHEKGAFTGAHSCRRGLFEQADSGTLFLDETGELPQSMQAKLLRALQEKQIVRVGSEKPLKVDVRIIAATNRDLKKMVEQGDFREDLFYRLNVIELTIPPLRERKEDIPALVDFFLQKYKSKAVFSQDGLNYLAQYDFPGNVRELEHIIQRAITFSRKRVIDRNDLPPELTIKNDSSTNKGGSLKQRLAELEYRMLMDALENNNWVQTKAAEELGISERVLRYKMKRANIKNK